MKRILTFVLTMLVTISTLADNVQKGYVKTRGRLDSSGKVIPGKRIMNATVVLQQGSSVVSDGTGDFSLKLPTTRFYLKNVKKSGFVVADPDILSKQYACTPNPLVLVLDEPTVMLDDKLASERKQRRLLQKLLQQKEYELDNLKEQNRITEAQYRERLQKLYDDTESNEKFISEMAERYSKLDFDQLDDSQSQIAAFIQNGELAKADSLLRTKGNMDDRENEINCIRRANAKERQELKERQKNLKNSEVAEEALVADFVADCYSHFELCKLKFENDSAAYWLERRVKLDSLNMDWIIELADFYYDYIADYNKAYEGFDRVIKNSGADIDHKLEAKYGKMKILLKEGRYDEALQEAISCQVIEDSINIPSRKSEFYMGCAYGGLGEYDKAREYFDKHLTLLNSDNDVDSIELSNAYNSIGCNYLESGKYEKAYNYIKKSMELREAHYQGPYLEIATSYLNMGVILHHMSEYEKALNYTQKALEMKTLILGRDHPLVATTLNNLGALYVDMLDYDRAISLIKEAIDINTKFFGPKSMNLATAYSNLGVLFSKKKDYQNALNAYEKSLAIKTIYFDKDNPNMFSILNNLGSAHAKLGNFNEALAYYNETMKICKSHFDDKNDKIALCNFNMGSLYMRQGKYEEAITTIESAKSIYESIFGNSHRNVADCNFKLGQIYDKLKDYRKARNKYNDAYNILLKIHGENHPHVISTKKAIERMDLILKNE